MRIGLFTDTYPPDINGVANSTYILQHELMKHGHTVYVITTYAGAGYAKWDEDGTVLRLAGVELKFLYGYVMTTPFHHHAIEEISRLNLDVIHAQTEFGIGIFARLVAKSLKIPLVSTYHTTYEDYTHYVNFIHSDRVDRYAKMGVAKVSRLYGDSSMEVIAPSEKTREMLLGYHIRRNINVIPTGLPLDEFDPAKGSKEKRHEIRSQYGFPDDERLIIYVGRLAEEKSFDIVLKGFAKARDEGTVVNLLVVGNGPELESLRQLTEDLKLSDHVKLIGPKLKEEIPDMYRCADAFVSASTSETQGMTFLEALASGLPLFCRHDEVLNNLLVPERTGWFFNDEEDLAQKLKDFMNMKEEDLNQMKVNARHQAEPWSSEVFYQRVIKVYERIIANYAHQYVIADVTVKDTNIQLYLISNQKEEMRLLVSLDDYYSLGLRKDQVLTQGEVEDLQYRQNGAAAYQRCLRKLNAKDRTRKEIYDWLTQNTECDIATINQIVEKLEDKGYINDERYCEENIRILKAQLAGHDKIVRVLKKRGLPVEMIERKLAEGKDDEKDNAYLYALKVQQSRKNDSVNKTKNFIMQKMLAQGYSREAAEDAISHLDFTKQETHETENLKRCAFKARKRYEKKYSSYDLRNRIYRYCCAQGYNSSDVYAVLDEMNWEDQ